MSKYVILSQLISEFIDYKVELKEYEIVARDYGRYGYQSGKDEIERKYNYIDRRLDEAYEDLEARICELESK